MKFTRSEAPPPKAKRASSRPDKKSSGEVSSTGSTEGARSWRRGGAAGEDTLRACWRSGGYYPETDVLVPLKLFYKKETGGARFVG